MMSGNSAVSRSETASFLGFMAPLDGRSNVGRNVAAASSAAMAAASRDSGQRARSEVARFITEAPPNAMASVAGPGDKRGGEIVAP